MGTKKQKIKKILVLLVLAVFPFGQLLGIFTESALNVSFRVHPIDIIVFFTLCFTTSIYGLKPILFKYRYIFVPIIFSFVLSIFLGSTSLIGFLYLIRLLTYLLFFVSIFERKIIISKSALPQAMIIVGVLISLFGWVQYLLYPDLVSLKYFGWDDHYYRLTSTMLDPAFTGILLVLAILLSLDVYLKSRTKVHLLATIFFLVSLAFTYSRASFAALLIGLSVLLLKKHKSLFMAIATALIILIAILPRNMGGEGVRLLRTSSTIQKIENYKDSLKIISSSPLFGVGYNNICLAKNNLSLNISKQENSCSGLDNSFLLIVASMGIISFIGFVYFFREIWPQLGGLWKASAVSLAFHTLFTNSIFYSWVIIWMALLLALPKNLRSKV